MPRPQTVGAVRAVFYGGLLLAAASWYLLAGPRAEDRDASPHTAADPRAVVAAPERTEMRGRTSERRPVVALVEGDAVRALVVGVARGCAVTSLYFGDQFDTFRRDGRSFAVRMRQYGPDRTPLTEVAAVATGAIARNHRSASGHARVRATSASSGRPYQSCAARRISWHVAAAG
jgi:hypothetical protein